MSVSITPAGVRATAFDLIDAVPASSAIGDFKLAAVTPLASLIPMVGAGDYFLARRNNLSS